MTTYIKRRYYFESAHFLPNVPDDHKCKNLHGHSYELEVMISGELKETGFVMDFFHLDHIVLPLIEKVDHKLLNSIEGLENPTAEIIARWFLDTLLPRLERYGCKVEQITCWENRDCCAIVNPW